MRVFNLLLGSFSVAFGLDRFKSPETMFSTSTAQSWFAPPRNIHPSTLASNIPIPTNPWWGNLIASGHDDKEILRVWTNPYAVSMSSGGLQVSYPFATRTFGGSSGNSGAHRYYLHAALNDLTINALEFSASNSNFKVTNWDDLGVTIRKEIEQSSMQASLVSGMAYASVTFEKLKPHFSTQHRILAVNNRNFFQGDSETASKFVLKYNNDQTWVLYATSPLTLEFKSTNQLASSFPFTGSMQMALVSSVNDISVYDTYKDCSVLGGKVYPSVSSYTFQWNTGGPCSSGLLHFGLHHHADILDPSHALVVNLTRLESTTRGAMIPIVTTSPSKQWTLTESKLIDAGFYPRQPPSVARVAATNLRKQLTQDIVAPWKLPHDGSYYFNGKAAQKYASLCLMASDSAVVGYNNSLLLDQCRKKLEVVLAPFISNTWKHKLVYDTIYKGIVSSEGFNVKDLNADFGNTMYNDHHYHYGYWIMTAAITNLVHPSMPGLSELNQRIGFLVRDVVNDKLEDKNFPTYRNFDWYRGHSYSHGVTAFADGKDQESSSEEINFHYGVMLFGQATRNPSLEQLGRLMLTVNARSVRTYFLMDSENRVHPPQIRSNKVTGIYFDNKVDYATWFSSERYCIHGIQMIPVSPVTEYVRTLRFVKEEWSDVLSQLPIVKENQHANPWLSLLYANYASVNPDVSMEKLQVVAMDDGLSRSWALYMAASRYL